MSRSVFCLLSVLLMAELVPTAHADTYSVNSTLDPGDGTCDATCTLRDAIIAANANAGPDTIDFSGIVLPTAISPVTIFLNSGLPLITDTLIMDASITETRVLPGSPVKRPGVELSLVFATPVFGPSLPFHPDGLNLSGPGASDSVIRGFVINGLDSSTHAQCLLADLNPDPLSTLANPFPRQGFCGVPISIFGANGVVVAGNYLNLDMDGVAPDGAGKAAVEIVDGSDNVIGGYGANDRNVMTAAVPQPPGIDLATMIRPWLFGWSDPAFGAPKKANNNQIIGNYIGLTAEGVSLDPGLRGIWLAMWNFEDDSPFGPGQLGWGVQCDDQELDPCEMVGNVVAGNTITATGGPSSVAIFGPLEDTVVNDNTIFNKSASFPAGQPYGRIEIFELTGFPGISNPEPGVPVGVIVSNNRLGIDSDGIPSGFVTYGIGAAHGRNHVIAGNTVTGALWHGVFLDFAQNVTITGNSIFGNALLGDQFGFDFLGIALDFLDGVTPNDFMDSDVGPNNLQNFPVLTWAQDWQGQIRVHGHLNSEPNKTYRIEFFANDVVNQSGHGEGKRFLGSIDVATNGGGGAVLDTYGSLEAEIGGDLVDIGDFVTATATELCTPVPEEGECPFGTASTSEFSRAVEVTEEPLTNEIAVLQAILDASPGTELADKVEDVIGKALTAWSELDKTPPDNQAFVGNIEGAVGDLEAAVGLDPTQDPLLVDVMDALTGAARQLAAGALAVAIDLGTDPDAVSDAQQALDEGDALRVAGAFKDAVSKFKDALAKAESVLEQGDEED